MKTARYPHTPGNPKRERKFDAEWFKRIPNKAFTQDEWIEKFRKELTPQQQFDYVKSILPREIKGESGHVIRFIIEGLEGKTALKALPDRNEIVQIDEPDTTIYSD